MKKLLSLPLLFLAAMAVAQQKTGIITFESTVFIDREQLKNSNLPEGFADMIPSEKKSVKVLYFTPDATLYENGAPKKEAQNEYSDGDMMFRVVNQEPDEKVFTDLKNKKQTEQKDLMGKIFLVQDEVMPANKWKTTGRQKKILGMPCMEATLTGQNEKDQISAWYTTAIPVSSGPDGMSGLPGMIMELLAGNTMRITAVKLDKMDAKDQKKIQPPGKGKKVTKKEYETIEQKKIAEMEEQFGGKGDVIFKIEGR